MNTTCLGVDACVGEDYLKAAPYCPHGPTLLFERYVSGSPNPRRYYACSACRNFEECKFFRWADEVLSKSRQKACDERAKSKLKPPFSHLEYFRRMKSIRKMPRSERHFCQSCSILLYPQDIAEHKDHVIKMRLTKSQLRKPSYLLQPLADNYSNAQYLFSSTTSQCLVDLITRLGKHRVLCIGTPRIFEELNAYNSSLGKETGKIKCLLLDLDHRLQQFFGPRQVCRYNMFNHHFFDGDKSRNVYMDFLREQTTSPNTTAVSGISGNLGDDFVIVLDPPFGGLVEVLSFTLKSISGDYQRVNGGNFAESILPVFWIFPYFMEPRITATLPMLSMLDYQVEYDNHSGFRNSSSGGMKNGSPVRIFTNLEPSKVVLPEEEGYWYCSECSRYSSANNRHCSRCNACTTKAGPTYVHCDQCRRCVKPSWKHCDKCLTCELPGRHTMSLKQIGCHVCGEVGHKRLNCPRRTINAQSSMGGATSSRDRKRKLITGRATRIKTVKKR